MSSGFKSFLQCHYCMEIVEEKIRILAKLERLDKQLMKHTEENHKE